MDEVEITEFNNCFIIRSVSLFSYFNPFLAAQGSDLPFFSRERGLQLRMSRILFAATRLNGTSHEQTIICRQLLAGHVVGSRPMARKKTMRRMIKKLLTVDRISDLMSRTRVYNKKALL